jgi:uncharacterized protein with HEPN domain
MSDKDKIILRKILKWIKATEMYTQDMDYAAFTGDEKTMSAAAFALGQIGELAKEVKSETQEANPQIEWKGMRGLRNRIIHDYENLDVNMLWEVIVADLPKLSAQINALL